MHALTQRRLIARTQCGLPVTNARDSPARCPGRRCRARHGGNPVANPLTNRRAPVAMLAPPGVVPARGFGFEMAPGCLSRRHVIPLTAWLSVQCAVRRAAPPCRTEPTVWFAPLTYQNLVSILPTGATFRHNQTPNLRRPQSAAQTALGRAIRQTDTAHCCADRPKALVASTVQVLKGSRSRRYGRFVGAIAVRIELDLHCGGIDGRHLYFRACRTDDDG